MLPQLVFLYKVDGVISCLASRSGTKSDSFAIDYQATLNCLEVAKKEKAAHFVMLSAFCVKKATLQFQKAKLAFEEKLIAAGDAGEIGYSIVRPTAFFKSVSGQLEVNSMTHKRQRERETKDKAKQERVLSWDTLAL